MDDEETMVNETEGDGAEETLAGVPCEAGSGDVLMGDKNPNSSSSSSSSDSESDDDEGAEELQIKALEKVLGENPMNYETHVQYIHILRKLGHIDKLRLARKSMSEHFPLSPQMWLEWTKDETSLSASSEDYAETEKLYERGVSDYLSIALWCDYLNFVQEHDPLVRECAPAGLSKMRNLCESALTAGGLHVVEGNKIWEAYREFEQAILLTIDDNNSEEKSKQIQRIRALFHRQLSVPLVDLRSTLNTYKHWEIEQGNANDVNSELDGVPHHIASSYRKALEIYNARVVYEDQLASCDLIGDDRLESYLSYIKYEESSGDPARVQVLYERAVSEFSVSSDLWLGYTSYIDRTLKVPAVLKGVHYRATKNCFWVGDLWARYLLSLERIHASEKELSEVFEQSMQCVFPSFNEYLDLFLTRVDGLRRRISSVGAEEDRLEYALMRETFQRAVDYLSPHVSPDVLLRLHAYWARSEANLGKDLVAARGVWESLIKKSGSVVEVWQSYVAMEIEMGNVNEVRSIYKRCYNKRFFGTGSEDICHSWLRFEREYGTLDDLDLAVKKVTPRLQELMMFKAQQEPKSGIPFSAKRENFVAANAPQKRKITNLSSEKQPAAKRPKRKDAELRSADSSYVDPAKKSRNVSHSVVDKVMVDTSSKAVGTGASNRQQIGDSKSEGTKSTVYKDQCTAFISNLSLEATKEHLQEFFADCAVTDIRILKDRFSGKSRGLAYVDFSDHAHLAAAIAKNRQKLLGKKLSIARSDPKQSQKKGSVNSSTSRGQGKLDLGNNDVKSPNSNVKLLGKNTFAAPRALVRRNKEEKTDEDIEKPKSNDQFREMFLKK